MTISKIVSLALFVILLLTSCVSHKNYVVLLPNPDGTVGEIVVANKGGTQVIKQANFVSNADSFETEPTVPVRIAEEKVQEVFGKSLDALPQAPLHFTLYFEFDSNDLAKGSREILPEVVRTIQDSKITGVSVIGHTDAVGSRERNYILGLDRANFFKRILADHGISVDMIDISSHGEDNPLVKTADGVAEPRNRRIEVVVR